MSVFMTHVGSNSGGQSETGPAEEAIGQATGTDDAGPVRCHQNRHHSVRETMQSGASG
jgi:hypothetical protein